MTATAGTAGEPVDGLPDARALRFLTDCARLGAAVVLEAELAPIGSYSYRYQAAAIAANLPATVAKFRTDATDILLSGPPVLCPELLAIRDCPTCGTPRPATVVTATGMFMERVLGPHLAPLTFRWWAVTPAHLPTLTTI